jgi:electron transfer flavoprotein beta subunit
MDTGFRQYDNGECMKILVSLKRVVDYNVKIRVKSDGTGVDTANVKMSMNPFDEIALEEAIRMKEQGKATEIVAVTIGIAKCEDILRTALAMGADRAIHITTDSEIQPLAAAGMLKKIVEQESPNLIILGKQAIDDDANQTGQMLAGLLNYPQATFASKIVLDGGSANVTREVDGGLMTIKVTLPAVVTTDLRLNEPRFVALPNILKARSKPIEQIAAESMGVDIAPKIRTLNVSEPAKRSRGIMVASASELVDKLKNVAKVI